MAAIAELMTPDHPRWKEFVRRLEGPEGCNFEEKDPDKPETTTWRCQHDMNRPFAKAILEKMGGFDVEASFKYFEENGGYCDCEILFNVNPYEGDEDEEGAD